MTTSLYFRIKGMDVFPIRFDIFHDLAHYVFYAIKTRISQYLWCKDAKPHFYYIQPTSTGFSIL